MIGRAVDVGDVRRVVLMLERLDGSRLAWEVEDATDIQWMWEGMSEAGRSQGRFTVAGSFRQVQRGVGDGR